MSKPESTTKTHCRVSLTTEAIILGFFLLFAGAIIYDGLHDLADAIDRHGATSATEAGSP